MVFMSTTRKNCKVLLWTFPSREKRLIWLLFSLVLILNSCVSNEVKIEKWIEQTMKTFRLELKQNSCNIITLNVPASTDVESYFIWKKYGVLVMSHLGDETREDSCYYEVMKEIIIEKKGHDKVKTIIEETEKLMKKSSVDGLTYFDGAYTNLLNSRLIDGSGAKFLDEENYYKVLDSLATIIKENINDGFLSFWVTVDTLGSLQKIEFINESCEESIHECVVKSFEKLKWQPAIFKKIPVNYRFRESIFIRNNIR